MHYHSLTEQKRAEISCNAQGKIVIFNAKTKSLCLYRGNRMQRMSKEEKEIFPIYVCKYIFLIRFYSD